MPNIESKVSVFLADQKPKEALKKPSIFQCLKCFYAWYSKSELDKPTCPACFSHNTKKVFP